LEYQEELMLAPKQLYLFRKSVAILISGRMNCGKTTIANLMKFYFTTKKLKVDIFPFAQGVKETAKFMGWDGDKDEKGRQLLIDIGMAGRKYNKDNWCGLTFDNIIPSDPRFPLDVVLVDDARFSNEINFVKDNFLYQTFVIRVEAPERELKNSIHYNDESEISMPSAPNELYDFVVDNSGSKKDLENSAIDLVERILKSVDQY
jgi:hypothetical protein